MNERWKCVFWDEFWMTFEGEGKHPNAVQRFFLRLLGIYWFQMSPYWVWVGDQMGGHYEHREAPAPEDEPA